MYAQLLKDLPQRGRIELIAAELSFCVSLAHEQLSTVEPGRAAAVRSIGSLLQSAERLVVGMRLGSLGDPLTSVLAEEDFATIADGTLFDDAARVRRPGDFVGQLCIAVATVMTWVDPVVFCDVPGVDMDGVSFTCPTASLEDVTRVMETLWTSACRVEDPSWPDRMTLILAARRAIAARLSEDARGLARSDLILSGAEELRMAWSSR